MRIAVTYDNGNVFQHYGQTKRFKIYDVENNQVVESTTISTNGSGHGALAAILKKIQVDTLICGGIGGGAKQALTAANIKFYGGVSGDTDEAVAALLQGTLQYNPDVACSHHGEHDHAHHEGACGEHGCGHNHGK